MTLAEELEVELVRVRQIAITAMTDFSTLERRGLIRRALEQAERATEVGHPANMILACAELRSIK